MDLGGEKSAINPLNAKLNPICHLLALLGGATIVVVSRLRVKLKDSRFCHGLVVFAVMGYYAMWVGQELETILLLKMDQQPIQEVINNQPIKGEYLVRNTTNSEQMVYSAI